MEARHPMRQKIAVIGTGISGLSAAWLLAGQHELTIYERDVRIGGHSCTVDAETPAGPVPVDMGFIVYNEDTYPNLKALFEHLQVPTEATDMSLSISLDDGRLEYGGGRLSQLFAQRRNVFRPRFWAMLRDLLRFYREAPKDLARHETDGISLGAYLDRNGYGRAFVDDHLLPMAGAIWSVPKQSVLEFPATAFIRFQENHGLLKIANRPIWRTVTGGSREYVKRLMSAFGAAIETTNAAVSVRRIDCGVEVRDAAGTASLYDQVVIATHADEALALLADATADEQSRLGAFRYNTNTAYLHDDSAFMPRRRAAWASWNYLGRSTPSAASTLTVTYWMNLLQNLPGDHQLFVTLNPETAPSPARVYATRTFEHPVMDAAAIEAQASLWSLQGRNRTWFCGAYFGAGFHEDGLQAGLAVAEAIGDKRRPWQVENESGRIILTPTLATRQSGKASA